jgi:hypothetical protein
MTTDRENPFRVVRTTRQTDWDPIRGLHQGQRPSVPHQKAGHMTAPDPSCSNHQNLFPRGSHPHTTLRPDSGEFRNALILLEYYYCSCGTVQSVLR